MHERAVVPRIACPERAAGGLTAQPQVFLRRSVRAHIPRPVHIGVELPHRIARRVRMRHARQKPVHPGADVGLRMDEPFHREVTVQPHERHPQRVRRPAIGRGVQPHGLRERKVVAIERPVRKEKVSRHVIRVLCVRYYGRRRRRGGRERFKTDLRVHDAVRKQRGHGHSRFAVERPQPRRLAEHRSTVPRKRKQNDYCAHIRVHGLSLQHTEYDNL